jgi:hypothetical protein
VTLAAPRADFLRHDGAFFDPRRRSQEALDSLSAPAYN